MPILTLDEIDWEDSQAVEEHRKQQISERILDMLEKSEHGTKQARRDR